MLIVPTLQSYDNSVVKNWPANAGAAGDSDMIPGSGRSPEEGNVTLNVHSSILAWEIP